MTHPLLEMLAQAHDRADGKPASLPAIEAQQETLLEFLGMPLDFKVGDFVRRNRFGKQVLNFPSPGQVAIITAIFDKPLYLESGENHGILAVVHAKHIKEYTVNFRHIERYDPK